MSTKIQLKQERYTASYNNDHIISIEVFDFEIFGVDDLMQLRKWIEENIQEKILFNLFNFGNGSSISKEMREYAASSEGAKKTIGTAVLVKNFAQQLIVDYYLKFNKPLYPTKAFYIKEKAIEWINLKVIEYQNQSE